MAILSRQLISILKLSDGFWYVCFYKVACNIGKSVMLCRLQKGIVDQEYHGLRYWKVAVMDGAIEFTQQSVLDFGVLLPKFGSDETGLYTIVTKEWSTEMFAEHNMPLESGLTPPNMRHTATMDNGITKTECIINDGWI